MIQKERYFNLVIVILILSLIVNGFLIITQYHNNSRQADNNYVEAEQIGVILQSDYHVNKEGIPEIHIQWSWTKPVRRFPSNPVQDIIAVSWDDLTNWVGTFSQGEGSSLGGGGSGPGIYALDQVGVNKGLSFMGVDYGKNGEITFKLLPNPPDSSNQHLSIHSNVSILLIHPQQKFSGKWVNNIVHFVTPPGNPVSQSP